MVLELIWVTGEVLSIVALLYGAYLALTATEMFQQLFARLKRAGGAHRAGGRASYQQHLPTFSNRA
jgi:hypothetical protein